MGWGVNEKALAKREREKEEKEKKRIQQYEKKQSAKWKDQVTHKKFEQKRKEQQKKAKQLQKKMELKELIAKQQAEMQKISKKKQQFETKKLTQAQILINQQKRLKGEKKDDSSSDQEEENPNRVQHDYEVARNVQQALNILDLGDDKHPQKRFRAAFQEFCDKRQVEMKLQNPNMKRTQRMQLLRKEFDKHPDNPFNKAHKAYNEK